MVFRRFHRTAGLPVLLAAFGIAAAMIIPALAPRSSSAPVPLPFVGYTNVAGQTRALFSIARNREAEFLNHTTYDRQHLRLIWKDAAGQWSTNETGSVTFEFAPGTVQPLIGIDLPEGATEFQAAYSVRVRRGKSSASGGGPPSTLVQLPWSRTKRYQSQNITISEPTPRPPGNRALLRFE